MSGAHSSPPTVSRRSRPPPAGVGTTAQSTVPWCRACRSLRARTPRPRRAVGLSPPNFRPHGDPSVRLRRCPAVDFLLASDIMSSRLSWVRRSGYRAPNVGSHCQSQQQGAIVEETYNKLKDRLAEVSDLGRIG